MSRDKFPNTHPGLLAAEEAAARAEDAELRRQATPAPRCSVCRARLAPVEVKRGRSWGKGKCDSCCRAAMAATEPPKPDLRTALAEFHAEHGVDE